MLRDCQLFGPFHITIHRPQLTVVPSITKFQVLQKLEDGLLSGHLAVAWEGAEFFGIEIVLPQRYWMAPGGVLAFPVEVLHAIR